MPQIAAGPYTAVGSGTSGVPSSTPIVLTQRAGYNIVIDRLIFNAAWTTAPGVLPRIQFANASLGANVYPANAVGANITNNTFYINNGPGLTLVGNSSYTQTLDFTVGTLGGGLTFTPASTDVSGYTNVLNIYTNTSANVTTTNLFVVYHYEKN
jgi:hypothetical protein